MIVKLSSKWHRLLLVGGWQHRNAVRGELMLMAIDWQRLCAALDVTLVSSYIYGCHSASGTNLLLSLSFRLGSLTGTAT